MRLETYLDTDDMGTPIEMANAIIKYYMCQSYCMDESVLEFQRRQLMEVTEHIQTYLTHNHKYS